jgi:hypothetical protein
MSLFARLRRLLLGKPLSVDRDDSPAERAARVGGTTGGLGAVFHGGQAEGGDDLLEPSEERLRQPD